MTTALPCPICGAAGTWPPRMTLEDLDGDESFSLNQCPGCGVLRTLPVPANLSRYYAAEVGQMMVTKQSALHTAARRFLLQRELDRIVPRVQPTTFMDIGCGPGDFAALIHHKGHAVMTFDVQAEPPVFTRDLPGLPHYQIDYDAGDIRGLAPAPGRVAILRHVLEHVKDPAAFLRRLTGYGAGWFYIAVPNAGCVEQRLFGRAWYLWDPPRPLWHFTPGAFHQLFRTLGFQVLASGRDTIPNIVPSLYRVLRLHRWPA